MKRCRGQDGVSTVNFHLLPQDLAITLLQHDLSSLVQVFLLLVWYMFCWWSSVCPTLFWTEMIYSLYQGPFIICKSIYLHLRIGKIQFECSHYWLVFVTLPSLMHSVKCQVLLNSSRMLSAICLTCISPEYQDSWPLCEYFACHGTGKNMKIHWYTFFPN